MMAQLTATKRVVAVDDADELATTTEVATVGAKQQQLGNIGHDIVLLP
jgi:hypothetical protein